MATLLTVYNVISLAFAVVSAVVGWFAHDKVQHDAYKKAAGEIGGEALNTLHQITVKAKGKGL